MAKFLDYATGLPALWAKIKGIIPTKTSDLTNDSGFVTSSDVPTAINDLSDVDTTGVAHDLALTYNNPTSTWKPGYIYISDSVTINVSAGTATFNSLTPKKIWENHENHFCISDSNGGVYTLSKYELDSGDIQAEFEQVYRKVTSSVVSYGIRRITVGWISKTATTKCTGTYNDYSIPDTTYTLSMSGNVITLTPSSGTASSITLPVYDGSVSGVLT